MSTRHFIPSKSSLANALKETPETFTGTHLSMPNRTAQIYGRSLPGTGQISPKHTEETTSSLELGPQPMSIWPPTDMVTPAIFAPSAQTTFPDAPVHHDGRDYFPLTAIPPVDVAPMEFPLGAQAWLPAFPEAVILANDTLHGGQGNVASAACSISVVQETTQWPLLTSSVSTGPAHLASTLPADDATPPPLTPARIPSDRFFFDAAQPPSPSPFESPVSNSESVSATGSEWTKPPAYKNDDFAEGSPPLPLSPNSFRKTPNVLLKKPTSSTSRKYRVEGLLSQHRSPASSSNDPLAPPTPTTKPHSSRHKDIEHVHITNIPCPHPSCTAPVLEEDPETQTSHMVYKCAHVDPRTGKTCVSVFKRRGCRDRHVSSHAGCEAQDVALGRLRVGSARTLLWETIRMVEASDWFCIVPREGTGRHHSKDAGWAQMQDLALNLVHDEFDIPSLMRQALEVKDILMGLGDTRGEQYPYIPVVDLAQYAEFERMAVKRSVTHERFYCRTEDCSKDFTRMDALVRHLRTCHSASIKGRGLSFNFS